MAISTNEVHDNLFALTGRMTGNTQDGSIHDDLNGMAELSSNEGEAEVADVIQTLSFTTWIKDICDGYKQEKELDVGTPEYDENANAIRADIQNINNLGRQMGFEKDIIPTPKAGQETAVAAQAVYQNFALPYEAEADIDYSKYMQIQEMNNQISRSMKRMSQNVAKSAQYGTHAKKYWQAQVDAAGHQNELTGEFLDGMASLDKYTKEIEGAKAFVNKEEANSELGISDIQMGGIEAGDKIDFENDDAKLQGSLSKSIRAAEHLIKTERAMLKAGHIDSKRRKYFESALSVYMQDIKQQKAAIEADDIVDMQATAELEQRMEENPDGIDERQKDMYMDMVEKQKNQEPTLTGKDLKECAKVAKLGVDAMNVSLIASGVTPINTSINSLQLLQMGKLVHDINSYVKKEESQSSMSMPSMSMEPKYRKNKKDLDEDEKQSEMEEDALSSKKFAMAVKKAALDFSDRMRIAVREGMIQLDENASDYEANQNFTEGVEHLIGDIVDENGNVICEANTTNQSKNLVGLANSMKIGTGYDVFNKDPQDMNDTELGVYSSAVTAVMAPMKDKEGKYLPQFVDCYAVGEEVMPDAQKEYTNVITDLMIVGKPDEAKEVKDAETALIDLSQQYQDLNDENDLTEVHDTSEEEAEIRKKAEAEDDKMRKIAKTYKPLMTQMGIAGATAAYHKHEFNKAWKESVHERNLQVFCQGTMKYMDEHIQEDKQKSQEFWSRLLRG